MFSFLNINKFPNKKYLKSRGYYENILEQYIELENYINIFSNKIDLRSLPTDINILPDLLGKNVKDIIRTKGNPEYAFQEKDISIFVYKRNINGLDNRSKIHFYKNKVFLVNHSYPSINEQEKIYVIKAVEHKYLNANNLNFDIRNCKIIDNNNSIIFIDDLMGLKISYFNNYESEWFTDMSSEIKANNELKSAEIRLKEKHFIDNI
ncbi:hypothetical protein ACPPVU_12730 [Mucilaginibacter sp. McL0603]|uniref:hypothetical protein n=1 Tax=Mucilaginibacter sp. McL0603 TaxID=3415670 RepID=UPI003CE88D77